MRAKPIMLLAVALGCGTVAAFAATQVIRDQGQGQAIDMVEILVATKDTSINTKISADRFQLEKWPRDRLPQGAVVDLKSVEGKFTNQRLYQGEPLVDRKINLSKENVAVPQGYRVFDLEVSAGSGNTGYIRPGDRVDVHGFFEKSGRILESKSMMVMENVEVFMVDGVAIREEEAGQKKASVIQLLIRASQYEALNTAAHLGKLKLSLTPPQSEEDQANRQTDNGDDFLKWVKTATKEDAPVLSNIPVPQPAMPAQPTGKQRQMLIISPTNTETYEWSKDGELPTKVTPETDSPTASNRNSNTMISGSSPYDSPSTQSQPGGMIWNGTAWTYNPSGFKPTYPSADDGKGDKSGYADKAEKSEKDFRNGTGID